MHGFQPCVRRILRSGFGSKAFQPIQSVTVTHRPLISSWARDGVSLGSYPARLPYPCRDSAPSTRLVTTPPCNVVTKGHSVWKLSKIAFIMEKASITTPCQASGPWFPCSHRLSIRFERTGGDINKAQNSNPGVRRTEGFCHLDARFEGTQASQESAVGCRQSACVTHHRLWRIRIVNRQTTGRINLTSCAGVKNIPRTVNVSAADQKGSEGTLGRGRVGRSHTHSLGMPTSLRGKKWGWETGGKWGVESGASGGPPLKWGKGTAGGRIPFWETFKANAFLGLYHGEIARVHLVRIHSWVWMMQDLGPDASRTPFDMPRCLPKGGPRTMLFEPPLRDWGNRPKSGPSLPHLDQP
jgi:hypothetical protein